MTSSASDAASGAWRIGTWIRGKYRLERILGAGGMAVVYAATHRNKKRVAVKMLRPELSMRPEIRARFLREGYVANTVDHPGAVAVLDEDVADDGAAFLVMELLEGKTVEALCGDCGGRLSVRHGLCVIDQLLDVLTAAHAKNVVHRDIKPSNLFLTRTGQVKVLDFGIARLREAEVHSNTQTGSFIGTPAFMAPEQAMGKASQVDAQSDVYSAGATLFSMLSGRDVHPGETPQHQVMLVATTRAPSVATMMPELHPCVYSIIDRALSFDKKDRWLSAAAMREGVRRAHLALFGEPLTAEPLASLGSTVVVANTPELAASPEQATDGTTVGTSPESGAMQPLEALAAGRVEAQTASRYGLPAVPPPTRGRSVVIGAAAAVVLAGALVVVVRAAQHPAAGVHATATMSTPAGSEAPAERQPASTNMAAPPSTGVPGEVVSAVPSASAAVKAPVPPRHGGPPASTRGGSAQHPPPSANDFDRQ